MKLILKIEAQIKKFLIKKNKTFNCTFRDTGVYIKVKKNYYNQLNFRSLLKNIIQIKYCPQTKTYQS